MSFISPAENPAHAVERHLPGNKTRRVFDTGGVVVFQIAIFGLFAWSYHQAAQALAIAGGLFLMVDMICFFIPPKRRPKLDPLPGQENLAQTVSTRSFAFELFVLLAPPVLFIAWLQFLIWQHQTLSRNELVGIVIGIPAVAGLISWIIKVRMTNHHVGVVNQTNKFTAYFMLGIWIGSTFLFVVFLGALVMKLLGP
jgi:hypothetical protein